MKEEFIAALAEELQWTLPEKLTLVQGGEGIKIDCDGVNTTLTYANDAALGRGLTLLKAYGTDRAYVHEEKLAFRTLGLMVDCSRNAVPKLEVLKQTLRRMALLGYNMMQLYTEDTYEIKGEPYFGYLRGRYTKEEIHELDLYAASLGIELTAGIQTLGHLRTIFHWKAYEPIRDCDDVLLCEDDRTYELIDKMLASVSEYYTSRRAYVGLDEAWWVGLGNYLKKHGYEDRFDILTRHIARVCKLAEKYDLQPFMAGDLFFHFSEKFGGKIPDSFFTSIPENLEMDAWRYEDVEEKPYRDELQVFKKFNRNTWFYASARKWGSITPSNKDSIAATRPAVSACLKEGVRDFVITLWGDDGATASLYSSWAAVAWAASLSYGQTRQADAKRVFRAATGLRFDEFLIMDHLKEIIASYNPQDNPQKCLFYNDPMLGIFDKLAADNRDEIIENLQKALPLMKRLSHDKKLGYMFATQLRLSEVLLRKFDFGVRLRAAYKEDNRAALFDLAAEAKSIMTLVEKFYETFRTQWYHENKPQGFEVQDIRIGGLLQRLRACNRTVQDYLKGKIDRIPELEETILDAEVVHPFHWQHELTGGVLGHL